MRTPLLGCWGAYPMLMCGSYSSEVLEIALPRNGSSQPFPISMRTYFIIHYMDMEGAIIACGGWTQQAPGSVDTVISGAATTL